MRQVLFVTVAIVVASSTHAGLFGPSGDTVEQKRQTIRRDSEETLKRLYAEKPALKKEIQKAPGYAVFNNNNLNLFLLSTGNGYGMVVDNKTKKETFMRMASIGGGIGLGAKDYRVVFVFKTEAAMKRFVDEGWQVGGSADAAAKAGEKGAAVGESLDANVGSTGAAVAMGGGPQSAVGGAGTPAAGMQVYQITESGLALQATIAGTKYWKDKDLNQ